MVGELEIPYGSGVDHAEGIAIVSGTTKSPQILVVYDSPSEHRREGLDGVRADVFELKAD